MPSTPTNSTGRHSYPGSASPTTNRNTPTRELSDSFDAAFDFFNQKLFGDVLPTCLITAQRKAKAGGYYAPGRFARRSDGSVTIGEIAVNPECWATQSVRQTLSTVVHEMVHHWQYTDPKAKPSHGYHNSEWSAKMVEIGLMPVNPKTRKPAKAAQSMSHEIVEGGPFDLAAAEFEAAAAGEDRDPVPFMEKWNEDDEKKAKAKAKRDTAKSASKSKWVCPLCGDIYRAKTTARPGCFKHEIPTACELEDAEAPEDSGDDDSTPPPPPPAPPPPKPNGVGSKAKASKAVAIIPAPPVAAPEPPVAPSEPALEDQPEHVPKLEPEAPAKRSKKPPVDGYVMLKDNRSLALVVGNASRKGIELRLFVKSSESGYGPGGVLLGEWAMTTVFEDRDRLEIIRKPLNYPEPTPMRSPINEPDAGAETADDDDAEPKPEPELEPESDTTLIAEPPPVGSYVSVHFAGKSQLAHVIAHEMDGSIMVRAWNNKSGRGGFWMPNARRITLRTVRSMAEKPEQLPDPPPLT